MSATAIADGPVLAASAQPNMTAVDRCKAFLATAQSVAADGLTWSEFGQLLVALLRVAIAAYDRVVGMDGPTKRAAAVTAVGQLFDLVADKAVPLAGWPLWVLCRPAFRSLVLALATGAVEQLLPLVRRSAA